MASLHIISQIIGIASVMILIFGALQALIPFVVNELKRFRGTYELDNITRLRLHLGQYILLGLELLIVSDVIETIVNPVMDEILQVGSVVVIRTVLSFFLNKEIAAENKKNN